MVNQNTALWIFAILALAYVAWMDVRPLVSGWRGARGKRSIKVQNGTYSECAALKDVEIDGKRIFANDFYIVVGNGKDDGSTLRHVQCRLFHTGAPHVLSVKETGLDEADIRHGEWTLFHLGTIISSQISGWYKGDVKPNNVPARYLKNVPRGYVYFDMAGRDSVHLGHRPDIPNVWELLAIISADDQRARELVIRLDMANGEIEWEERKAS